jgi:hypothetical protein
VLLPLPAIAQPPVQPPTIQVPPPGAQVLAAGQGRTVKLPSGRKLPLVTYCNDVVLTLATLQGDGRDWSVRAGMLETETTRGSGMSGKASVAPVGRDRTLEVVLSARHGAHRATVAVRSIRAP